MKARASKKTPTLWAVHYRMQNAKEGWLVAKTSTAEEAIGVIVEQLADPSSDYSSLKLELTAYRCGKWL
jgi:hypothetical protein